MYLQECYQDLHIPQGTLSITEELSETEISLPMYYGMTEKEISAVIEVVNSF